jgi:hypothetical protein
VVNWTIPYKVDIQPKAVNNILTCRASVEIVVVLGNIGEDAEPVWNPQGHHVLCIQQSRDPQLLLSNTECLEEIDNHDTAIKSKACITIQAGMGTNTSKCISK